MAIENFAGFDVISDVGATANSYASVADTKSRWLLDPWKKDFTFDDESIGIALINATKILDTQYGSQYSGVLYDEANALFWPRTGVIDSRGISITDYTVFPAQLQEAVSCFAYSVLQSDRTAEVEVDAVIEKSMDGLGTIKWDSYGTKRAAATKQVVPADCISILGTMITGSTSKYVELLSRG